MGCARNNDIDEKHVFRSTSSPYVPLFCEIACGEGIQFSAACSSRMAIHAVLLRHNLHHPSAPGTESVASMLQNFTMKKYRHACSATATAHGTLMCVAT